MKVNPGSRAKWLVILESWIRGKMSMQEVKAHELKAEAKTLRAYLASLGCEIRRGQALEAVARMHGFKDWNTASAACHAWLVSNDEAMTAESDRHAARRIGEVSTAARECIEASVRARVGLASIVQIHGRATVRTVLLDMSRSPNGGTRPVYDKGGVHVVDVQWLIGALEGDRP